MMDPSITLFIGGTERNEEFNKLIGEELLVIQKALQEDPELSTSFDYVDGRSRNCFDQCLFLTCLPVVAVLKTSNYKNIEYRVKDSDIYPDHYVRENGFILSRCERSEIPRSEWVINTAKSLIKSVRT